MHVFFCDYLYQNWMFVWNIEFFHLEDHIIFQFWGSKFHVIFILQLWTVLPMNQGSIWVFPKIGGTPPQIIHFNRVVHSFHHPFWGVNTPIFGSIPIYKAMSFFLQDYQQGGLRFRYPSMWGSLQVFAGTKSLKVLSFQRFFHHIFWGQFQATKPTQPHPTWWMMIFSEGFCLLAFFESPAPSAGKSFSLVNCRHARHGHYFRIWWVFKRESWCDSWDTFLEQIYLMMIIHIIQYPELSWVLTLHFLKRASQTWLVETGQYFQGKIIWQHSVLGNICWKAKVYHPGWSRTPGAAWLNHIKSGWSSAVAPALGRGSTILSMTMMPLNGGSWSPLAVQGATTKKE